MKPFEENWQQDSGRKFNAGRDGENQNERKSFNPNFSNENRLNRSNDGSDSSIKKPRKRVGETRVNVDNNNYNRPRTNDYQPRDTRRGNYDGNNYSDQRNNYRDNNGGYNNSRGNYQNNNGGGNYNSQRNNNYNQNRDNNYNNNYRSSNGNYNNDRDNRENNYNSNRDYNNQNNQGGGYNNQGGGYNNNRGGYSNNRGGYNNGGNNGSRSGGYNQGGNRRPNSFNNNNNNRNFSRNNNHGGNFDNNSRPQIRNNNRQIEYRSIVVDPNEPIRLNKFLANAGVCSRREADELIQAGVVSVNGEPVSELGTKILRGDKVMIHDQLVSPDKKVYILLNKPKDCVTTSDDPFAKLTVMDLVKNACRERIYPVGRLDRNTTGVLLLTNDGDLAAKLTHPKYNKKKIYQVALDRPLEQTDFDQLLEGITLEDGEIKADDLNYIDESDAKKIGIEIHSGKNRVVRRLFEHLNYRVTRLDRVYFAGLTKKNLKRGQWRFLSEREVSMLRMGAFK